MKILSNLFFNNIILIWTEQNMNDGLIMEKTNEPIRCVTVKPLSLHLAFYDLLTWLYLFFIFSEKTLNLKCYRFSCFFSIFFIIFERKKQPNGLTRLTITTFMVVWSLLLILYIVRLQFFFNKTCCFFLL